MHLRSLFGLIAIVMVLVFSSCNMTLSPTADSKSSQVVATALSQGMLRGVVSDSTGAPLAEVVVTAGSATTRTDSRGSYSFAASAAKGLKVEASQAGFVSTFRIVDLSIEQTITLNFTLSKVGTNNTLTNMRNTTTIAKDPRGAQVIFQPNSVVNSTGESVDSANVAVTVSLASDKGYAETFPGLFAGVKDGEERPLESFGIVTVDITSSTGEKSNLRPGMTAELTMPVSPTADPGTATIDLWSVDETTGLWIYEGVATRMKSEVNQAVVYRANVTHFSTYNLDVWISSPTRLEVRVLNCDGMLVQGAQVTYTMSSTSMGVISGMGITNSSGIMTFSTIPGGMLYYIYAVAGDEYENSYTVDTSFLPAILKARVVLPCLVPPTLSLATTSTLVTVPDTITLTPTYTGSFVVAQVKYYEVVPTVFSTQPAPFTTNVGYTFANNGTHTYRAMAYNAAGYYISTSNQVFVTVNIPLPSVTLTPSSTYVNTAGAFTLTARVYGIKTVGQVMFFSGTTDMGCTATTPTSAGSYTYICTKNLTRINNGPKSFTAKVYSTTGTAPILLVTSAPVAVTVNIPPPSVILTASRNPVTTAGAFTLTATVGGVSPIGRVEFYSGATKLACTTSTATPAGSSTYTCLLNLTRINNGTKSFTAKVYNTSTSTTSVVTSAVLSVVVSIP